MLESVVMKEGKGVQVGGRAAGFKQLRGLYVHLNEEAAISIAGRRGQAYGRGTWR